MAWNPEQYLKFAAERAAPFADLVALLDVRPGLHAVDLGCGTGELTAKLAEMLPHAAARRDGALAAAVGYLVMMALDIALG